MSEYQHYQFMADKPLTDGQLAHVRALSTRADLTRHSFVNTYQWGDFKGDPQELVEDCYDAHLYFANWGTRRVILRWPATVLPLAVARTYCAGGSATSRQSGPHVLITLTSDPEDCVEDFEDLFGLDHEYDEDRSQEWLPSITRAREQVAEGDLRLLYLAWLLGLSNDEFDDGEHEPPVPPGLAQLPEPLSDLATFLRIDEDLVEAAARNSPHPAPRPSLGACRAWAAALAPKEKDRVLAGLLHDEGDQALSVLRRRFLHDQTALASSPPVRTVAEIREESRARAKTRKGHEQRRKALQEEKVAEARKRAEREAQRARDQRVAELQHDPEAAWARVAELLSIRGTRHYPEVVRLLGDLAALAERDGAVRAFAQSYDQFVVAHRTKKALIRKLKAEGPVTATLSKLASD
ncbi:hypothetical protein ACFZB2_39670 [Streptomyces bobili]|uniref:hypothetical protein n=1 Tax=Streptomyces bobili TaxID=67280 RepID=UPI0036F18D48